MAWNGGYPEILLKNPVAVRFYRGFTARMTGMFRHDGIAGKTDRTDGTFPSTAFSFDFLAGAMHAEPGHPKDHPPPA